MVNFKDISGFRGYKVGDDGSVWTQWERGPGAGLSDRWKRMTLVKTAKGYWQVTLTADGKQRARQVHRLVLLAFSGHPPTYKDHRGIIRTMIACHGPRGKDDNSLSNLTWGTHQKNSKDDKIRDGTLLGGERHPMYGKKHPNVLIRDKHPMFGRKGDRNPIAKVKDAEIRLIKKRIVEGVKGTEIARELMAAGVDMKEADLRTTISRIKHDKQGQHIPWER